MRRVGFAPGPGGRRAFRRPGLGGEGGGAALTAGTATLGSVTSSSVAASATEAGGGTAPYVKQWQRTTRGGSSWTNIGGDALSLSDSTVAAGTNYDYRCQYTDQAAAVVYSNTLQANVPAAGGSAPSAPTLSGSTGSGRSADLSWTNSDSETGYTVYRGAEGATTVPVRDGTTQRGALAADVLSFVDTFGDPLTAGTASADVNTSTSVNLNASAPSGGLAPYTYQWYRSASEGLKGAPISGATERTYTDTGLETGTTYWYTLTVSDANTISADYPQVACTPASYAAPDLTVQDFETGALVAPDASIGTVTASAYDASTGGCTFVTDPYGVRPGTVMRIDYNNVDAGLSRDKQLYFGLAATSPYGQEHLTYGQTIWFRGRLYLPTPPAGLEGMNRKLVDYFENPVHNHGVGTSASTRAVLHAEGNTLKYTLDANDEGVPGHAGVSTGITLPFDTWVTIELRLTMNSIDASLPGGKDGVFDIYINGSSTPDFSAIEPWWIDGTTVDGEKSNLGRFAVGKQVTVNSGTAGGPFSEHRLWDDVAFSTTRIGA